MKAIIEMAREVGIDWHRHWNDDESNRLEQFAALVRADERKACADAVRFADNGTEAAEIIRARGNT